MIGQMEDPRTAVISDLSAKVDRFLAAGKIINEIAPGVSGEKIGMGLDSHHEKLRAERDKQAPTLQRLADQGCSIREAADAMNTCQKRIKLIARENGITFGGKL
jgi:hypothetical protein